MVLIIFIILILLGGCSSTVSTYTGGLTQNKIGLQPKQEVPDYFIPRELNIASIGDSLTQGVGDETKQGGYTTILKENLMQQKEIKEVTLNNYGVKGHKTTDLLNRLDDEEVQKGIAEADIIIITIGGNDIMKIVRDNLFDLSFEVFQSEQTKYEKRLYKVLEKIRDYNSDGEIVLVGLYNPFGWLVDISIEINAIIDNWNEGSSNVLSEFTNTKYVTVADIFSNSEENLLASDEFHPNAKGYELISERILKTILTD
ncbi:SGNH/GDSL hydrolase family protein [Fredinandcohnia humi]